MICIPFATMSSSAVGRNISQAQGEIRPADKKTNKQKTLVSQLALNSLNPSLGYITVSSSHQEHRLQQTDVFAEGHRHFSLLVVSTEISACTQKPERTNSEIVVLNTADVMT